MASTSKVWYPHSLTEAQIDELMTNKESEYELSELSDLVSSGEEDSSDRDVPAVNDSDEIRVRKRASTEDSLFKWRSGAFHPNVHNFDNSNSGFVAGKLIEESSILDIFEHFFSLEFMQTIADETNNFYTFVTDKRPPPPSSRLQQWKNTTPQELYIFLAITLLMTRVKKLTVAEYWSTDPLLSTPQFSDLMSRDRYLLLLRLLHFCDNTNQPQGDKLYKLKPVIETLRSKFSEVFSPFKNLCIDESLMLFKGRLSFAQYIPLKRRRFGIKLFVICDCKTGFINDFIVYTGKDTDIIPERDLGVAGAVVKTLIHKYLHKGHTLWLDNWYSSSLLFDWLHKNTTNACGTVRKNRKEMPKFTEHLRKGQIEAKHTDNILAVRWLDRREVCMLTTIHQNEMKETCKKDRQTGENITKPHCVIDYNVNMGAVDKTDMMVTSVECIRKTVKWYKKLFFHLLDITLLNSQCLYNVKFGKNISLADYQLALIREIIQKYHIPRTTGKKKGRPSAGDQPLRLKERHFPSLVPPTEKKKNTVRYCHVCSNSSLAPKKRRESRYECIKCDVGLCVHHCFEKYHTLQNF